MPFSEPLTDEELHLLREFILEHPDSPSEHLIERLGRILLAIRRESEKTPSQCAPESVAALRRRGRRRFDAGPSEN